MELTQEQSAALHNAPESRLELIDPSTQRQYILVAAEELQRMQDDADDIRHALGWFKATQQGMSLALRDDE